MHVLWDAWGEGRCCSTEGAVGIYRVALGAGPYLQQGLGRFMDGNDVCDLVPG